MLGKTGAKITLMSFCAGLSIIWQLHLTFIKGINICKHRFRHVKLQVQSPSVYAPLYVTFLPYKPIVSIYEPHCKPS